MDRNSRCRAAVFDGPSQPFRFTDYVPPALAPGEVLVRVRLCTLCASDLHTYEGHRTTPTPTVLGHEIVGEIAAMAPGENSREFNEAPLNIGDRVTWSIAASCGDCFFCKHGLPQKCERLFKYGHEAIKENHPLSGGLAEYCHLAPGTALFRVPNSLPDEVVCPANCATATVAAAFGAAEGCRGKVVLIQGTGMLGLTACAMASAEGAREIIAADVDPARLEMARRFGATGTVRVGQGGEDLPSAVRGASEGRGADLAFELCGDPEAFETGIQQVRIGGCYVLVGAVFPTRAVSVSAEMVVRRLLRIRGVHNYAPEALGRAVQFLTEHHARYPFAELVSESHPLSEVEVAFRTAIDNRALRVAVEP